MSLVTKPPAPRAPQVEAAHRFVEATGKRAVIGRLDAASRLLDGTEGTTVEPGVDTRP